MRTPRLLAALLLAAATCLTACTGQAAGGRAVVVLGPWLDDPGVTTDESDVFRQVLGAYGRKHDLDITYQGTRAIGQALRAKAKDGTLPDIAILPNVGELATYATEELARPIRSEPVPAGAANVRVDHRAFWRGRNAYAVAVKTDLKSLVLYDPSAGPLPAAMPTTLPQLMKMGEDLGPGAWCLGMSASSAPGWPGTDWIEDLLLHQAGHGAYERWASGRLPWTSAEVRAAWKTFGPIAAGRNKALVTSPDQAAEELFRGECRLLHQSSFYAHGKGNFLSFPPEGGGIEVSGDFATLFSDDPAAAGLLASLVEGSDWVARSRGLVYPVTVRPTQYGPQGAKVAQSLAGATRRCLDASDAMPATMAAAFHNAVLEFIAAPDSLDRILRRLEALREPLADQWLQVRCTP